MTNEIHDYVKQWLESNGQALELQAARICFRHCLPIEQSVRYKDPLENKKRETDLVIDLAKTTNIVNEDRDPLLIVVECKKMQGSWVGVQHFSSSRELLESPKNVFAFGGNYSSLIDIKSTGIKSETDPCGAIYATGAKGSNRNAAYDATRQALSAAMALGKERSPSGVAFRKGPKAKLRVAMAVVVTSTPLFQAWLNSENDLIITQVEGLEVWTDSPDGKPHLVTVLTQTGLDSWADKVQWGWILAGGYGTSNFLMDPNFP